MANIPADAITTPQNKLLAALLIVEWSRLRATIKPLFMPLNTVLYEPNTPVNWVYFPVTTVISISYVLLDGKADAVLLVGREGFACVPVFLGSDSPSCRAVVESEGWGYRVEREVLKNACAREGLILRVLLRYTQSYITQVAQTTVCNRLHSIDQQLCRWLLNFLDRLVCQELSLTHERIAELMGVRRESVTEAAKKLQIAGAIHYRRGHISVVKRAVLEARTCECYRVAKWETDRLVPTHQAGTHRSAIIAHVDRGRSSGARPMC